MKDYKTWFSEIAQLASPHDWQQALAAEELPASRLIRIPTGFGKTAGVVLPWLYRRMCMQDERWPRRLVYCLPMRVLELLRLHGPFALAWLEAIVRAADMRASQGVGAGRYQGYGLCKPLAVESGGRADSPPFVNACGGVASASDGESADTSGKGHS